jgi:hypothetical protein
LHQFCFAFIHPGGQVSTSKASIAETNRDFRAQQNPVITDGVCFEAQISPGKSVLRFGDFSDFGDFAALDAGSAHAQLLGSAVYECLYGLQVHIPAAASNVVCVRNVIAKTRAFAADIACLCHDTNSSFFSLCGAGTAIGARSWARTIGLPNLQYTSLR